MAVLRILKFMLPATFVATSVGFAQTPDAPAETAAAETAADVSPQDQLDQIVREYQMESSRLSMEIRSARDAEARTAASKKLSEVREAALKQLETIAEENAKTPVARKALETILYPMRAPSQETQQWAKDRLLEDHANDKELVPVIPILARDSAFLESLAEKSEDRDVQGVLLYYRMQSAKGRTLTEQNEAEVMPMMERICEEFKDVELVYPGGRVRGKLGELVENEIFAFKNLRIGKVAPEIEGADVHGQPLRLSDFRGKVVVLDFWGHW